MASDLEKRMLRVRAAMNRAKAAKDQTAVQALQAEMQRLEGLEAGTMESQQALMRPEARATARNPAAVRAAQDERDRKMLDPTFTVDPEIAKRKGWPLDSPDLGANFRAGMGSGMTSVLRALGGSRVARALGLPDDKEEANRTDKPLLDTTAGSLGRTFGQAAPATLAIPFTPATFAGAVGAGGLTGAAMTEGDALDRLEGGLMGASGSAVTSALPAAFRVARGGYRGVTEPLTTGGRRRIAGRTLGRFGLDADELANLEASGALANLSPTGSRLTLAEMPGLSTDARRGLATLQRSLETMDPETAAAFAARQEANNAARVDALGLLTGESTRAVSRVPALDRIARSQPTRAQAEATRAGNAAANYGKAYKAGIVPGSEEAMAPQIQELLRRPSVQEARVAATRAAAEAGLNEVPENSVQGLHFLKKALDEQKGALNVAGKSAEAGRVGATAAGFDDLLENLSPLYQQARRQFQFDSAPVTRAEIGGRLLDATRGAVRDFSGNRPLQAQQFAKALNDENRLMQQATGFKGREGQLSDVLTPGQLGVVNNVRDELEMLANLDKAANGKGSQTAKMLASQNLLRSIAGPTGMPESWLDNVVAENLQRLPHWLGYRMADPRIQQHITQAMLEPKDALALLMEARKLDQGKRTLGPVRPLLRRMAPVAIGTESANAAAE